MLLIVAYALGALGNTICHFASKEPQQEHLKLVIAA
jgi:hypothetical protein